MGRVQEDWGGDEPGDFDCFRRAENIKGSKKGNSNCPQSTRKTYTADASYPAADHAAEGAAALALTAALFRQTNIEYAKQCMGTATAMYDFARKYPTRGVTQTLSSGKKLSAEVEEKNFVLGFTYNTTAPEVNMLWSSAVMAWVHDCDNGWPCNTKAASTYESQAWGWWGSGAVRSLGVLACMWTVRRSAAYANA